MADTTTTVNDRQMRASVRIDEVLRQHERLDLSFIDKSYDQFMRKSYIRTLTDVFAARDLIGAAARPLRVLEIGAFTGVVSTAMRAEGFDVTAQDMPLFMNDATLRRHFAAIGAEVIAGDLRKTPLPAPDQEFDLIVCCEVIEHLNFNPLPLLRDFRRLLRRGGALYLATPNQANIVKRLALLRGRSIHDPIERLEWQLDPKATFSIGLHWREYTRQEMHELLAICGFTVLQHRYVHYSDRSASAKWRQLAVSAMYRVFPQFLPGQTALALAK